MKRVAVALLWVYSGWAAGATGDFLVGIPTVLGVVVGVVGATFFGLDPFGVVWRHANDTPSRVGGSAGRPGRRRRSEPATR